MKNLNEYIKESLLNDEETLVSDTSLEDTQWVKDNYEIFKQGRNGTKDFTVVNGVLNAPNTSFMAKINTSNLTNGNFKFGEVGAFDCVRCNKLKTLENGPTKVRAFFSCDSCAGLKNLIGAPEFVGNEFSCTGCKNLESLEGAPEYIGGDLDFSHCKKLKSIKGFPKIVKGDVIFDDCSSLSKSECDKLIDLI